MQQIGKYIILRKAEYPAWEKAHKLARCLSVNDIELILAGKKHLHLNPRKRKALEPEKDDPYGFGAKVGDGIYPVTGE